MGTPGGNALPLRRFWKELVFLNQGRHCNLAIRPSFAHANHFAFAVNSYAFGQGDFRRQGKGELNSRTGLDRRIQVEADSPGADIARLRRFLISRLLCKTYGNRKTQGEPARRPPFWDLCHGSSVDDVAWLFTKGVSRLC